MKLLLKVEFPPLAIILTHHAGTGEWIDKERNKVLLLWKKPEDWANIFIKWV